MYNAGHKYSEALASILWLGEGESSNIFLDHHVKLHIFIS